MKTTGIVRKVDELGRIVIPKEMRDKMGINCGDPIEIYVEADKIILEKYENCCSICGSLEELKSFKGRNFCKSCLNEIKKATLD